MKIDVLVVGGGPAGIGAAVAAARNGAEALLLEGTNCLGGLGTNSLVPMIRTAGDNGGIVREYWELLQSCGGCVINETHANIVPSIGKLAALDMVLSSGAKVHFHTLAEGVKMRNNFIESVYTASKDGRTAITPLIVVDASGDGDIAAWAGNPYEKGSEDGKIQALSFNFIINGVELDKRPLPEEFKALVRKAVQNGELELPEYSLKKLALPGNSKMQIDMAFNIDASTQDGLTQAEIICQKRLFMFWKFLKKYVSGFEKAVLTDIASYAGVRETRRIIGKKTLCEEDVMKGVKHPDGICRCSWYMDLHDGQNKDPLKEYRAARAPAPGDYYDIPYGCLVPLKTENLLLSGRCISSTRAANGSLRLQTSCMNLGQAAGTAAALCAKRKISPATLDPVELRSILKQQKMEI